MRTKILVAEIPDWEDLKDALLDILDDDDRREESHGTYGSGCSCTCKDWGEEDVIKRPTPFDPIGIAGRPENKSLRFGADFEIDEPRAEDYSRRWEFESDHAAYDRFVTAGEDCIARGLAKPSGVVTHKCDAIRRGISDGPVFGVDLLGETHWGVKNCSLKI